MENDRISKCLNEDKIIRQEMALTDDISGAVRFIHKQISEDAEPQ